MQLVLLVPAAVVRPRKIMVLAADLTILMHPNNLERNIRVGCDRLVVLMCGDGVFFVGGAGLLGLRWVD